MASISGTMHITLQGKVYSSEYFRPLLNLGNDDLISSMVVGRPVEMVTNKPVALTLELFTLDAEHVPYARECLKPGENVAVQESSKKLVGYFSIDTFND